ncbi:MAG: hypothetical protein ACFCVA_02865 [Gammaproteobacteria bacterium]
MGPRSPHNLRSLISIILALSLLPIQRIAAHDPYPSAADPLQSVVLREIELLRQHKDFLSAIARLQQAKQQKLLSAGQHRVANWRRAELLLDYGLQEAAETWLLALEDDAIPDSARDRSWHRLAEAFFHKGYLAAAKRALEQVTGELPPSLRGDHQLLRAHILMALDSNRLAADELRRWQGLPDQSGYAHYNRGIALMRAGEYAEAMVALEQVIAGPTEGEELLTLRDRANLVLGNLALQTGDPQRAQAAFESVRLQGAYSNRALLGAGWAALARERKQEALLPWLELRRRGIIDPAVQEALLTVPAVKRELRTLTEAARLYEEALGAFSDELQRLGEAIEAVREGNLIGSRHSDQPRITMLSASAEGIREATPVTRYLGRLLAGHDFQAAWRAYRDLLSLQETLAEWLRRLDALDDYRPPIMRADGVPPAGESAPEEGRSGGGDKGSASPSKPIQTAEPTLSASEWIEHWETGPATAHSAQRRTAPLPEMELPAQRAVNPLPQSKLSGQPTSSQVIWLPSRPDVLWLPETPAVKWLPNSAAAGLPDSGELRLPQPNDEQASHPEFTAMQPTVVAQESDPNRVIRQIPRPHGAPPADSPAAPTDPVRARPSGEMSNPRLAQLGHTRETPPNSVAHTERIAALRARILALQPRIASALEAHASYVSTLALRELANRQRRLQAFLQQAELELAKTYDLGG